MDDDRPLIDPRLFAPSELIGEDMEHSVDVTGDTSVEVNHTLDLDFELPVRRVELGGIAFAALVAALGTLTAVGATVQLSAALGVVLVGNALLRAVGR
jgi:hypothetical protein